jgi:RNA polymerase sigma-70 factor (ECF subfamily)
VAERRIESESLVAALARLGTVDREVLACRYVAGLSEAETAEVLGTPAGTVKSRTSRALERLARELGGNDA